MKEVSHETLVLRFQYVLFRFSGFLVASLYLQVQCRFAWQAWQVVTFSRVCKWCRKSFCVTDAILLQGFQNMAFLFHGMCSTLDVSMFILRGRRSSLDVSCCVFFLLIALSGLRQVVTTCKSRGKRGASRECHFAWQVQYIVQIHCVWM